MVQPPYQPPPPPPRRGFLQFGVGGAIVIIAISVLGTFARIHNARTKPKYDAKVNAEGSGLPLPGSEGTLAKGGAKAALCPVPANAAFFGWPCKSERSLPADSKVRVMKAGFSGGGKCRYWVQGGPMDNEAGDAPCEWFVPQ